MLSELEVSASAMLSEGPTMLSEGPAMLSEGSTMLSRGPCHAIKIIGMDTYQVMLVTNIDFGRVYYILGSVVAWKALA